MHRFTTTKETCRTMLRVMLLAACFSTIISTCSAQNSRVPTPARPRPSAPSVAARVTVRSTKLSQHLNVAESSQAETENSLDFGTVPLGQVGFGSLLAVALKPKQAILSIDIKDDDSGVDASAVFKYEKGDDCDNSNGNDAIKCYIAIGFAPSDDHSAISATVTVQVSNDTTPITVSTKLTGRGSAASCLTPKAFFFPLNKSIGFPSNAKDTKNWVYPTLPKDVTSDQAKQLLQDFGDPLRKLLVNCFYSTNDLFSAFNQFQSTYNAASGAATVSAQLGSLNFINGMQIAVSTNPQITQSSSNSSTSATPAIVSHYAASLAAAATPPTLAATSAAQATQNILNGGSVFATLLYPFFFRQTTYTLLTLSPTVKEGVDYQKFNNSSFTLANPATHTFVGLQAYFKVTAITPTNSTDSPGYLFFSGNYGYSLMTHSYSVQNGFGGRVNSQIGQIGAGILLKNVATIAAYRGFGPSQTFVDGTTQLQTTANNFKTWSVALSYQKASSSK